MVYGIINDVVRNGIEQVDILIYDLVQAFDSLWLHDCLNDIYDLPPHHHHTCFDARHGQKR